MRLALVNIRGKTGYYIFINPIDLENVAKTVKNESPDIRHLHVDADAAQE